MKHFIASLFTVIIFISSLSNALSQINEEPLLLSEMTWVEVQAYLKDNDMIIIPLGSIEQHGRHLPTGTDYFSAVEISKIISAEARIIVAPILLVGYSEYHSGFPGTISISPETMEMVVFECIESLINHGFKRFMFFNAHGGNNIVQENLLHRINSSTGANAISIGVGSPFWPTKGIDYFDWHAGKFETSLDLCLFPDLVQIENAEKPIIKFPEKIEKIRLHSEDYPDLNRVWEESMIFLPEESGKGTAVHAISSNGVLSFNDPRDASAEYGKPFLDDMVSSAVTLIEAWKLVK